MAEDSHDPSAASRLFVQTVAPSGDAADSAGVTNHLAVLRKALRDYFIHAWKEFGDAKGIQNDNERDAAFAKAMGGRSSSWAYKVRTGKGKGDKDKDVTVEHLALLAGVRGIPVIAVLAEVSVILAVQMGGPVSVGATGSTEGGAVTQDTAEKMRASAAGRDGRRRGRDPREPGSK